MTDPEFSLTGHAALFDALAGDMPAEIRARVRAGDIERIAFLFRDAGARGEYKPSWSCDRPDSVFAESIEFGAFRKLLDEAEAARWRDQSNCRGGR
jgi:hypothetical protein